MNRGLPGPFWGFLCLSIMPWSMRKSKCCRRMLWERSTLEKICWKSQASSSLKTDRIRLDRSIMRNLAASALSNCLNQDRRGILSFSLQTLWLPYTRAYQHSSRFFLCFDKMYSIIRFSAFFPPKNSDRSTSGGPYDLVASPTTNSYSDTGLTASTAYYYIVTVVDNAGNKGAPSPEASGTTSEAPALPRSIDRATVTIVDADGVPVEGATVYYHSRAREKYIEKYTFLM